MARSISFPGARCQSPARQKPSDARQVAADRLLLQRVALVVQLLAAADAEIDLDAPVLEEHLQRHERQSLRLGLQLEVEDLLRVHEQLALALRLVVEPVAEAVARDVRPQEPELALQHGAVGPGERDLPLPARLHLGSRKDDTALDRLEYGIVVPGLSVLGEDGIELPFLSRHTASSRRCVSCSTSSSRPRP